MTNNANALEKWKNQKTINSCSSQIIGGGVVNDVAGDHLGLFARALTGSPKQRSESVFRCVTQSETCRRASNPNVTSAMNEARPQQQALTMTIHDHKQVVGV